MSISRGMGYLSKSERASVLGVLDDGLSRIGQTLADLPAA
jgi:hypothetical protein